MNYLNERETAIQAVTAAMKICQEVRSGYSDADAQTKDDHSPVTVADYASQAEIIAALQNDFPSDPVVGEEDAGELRGEENRSLLLRIAAILKRDGDEVCELIDSGSHTGGAEGRFWTLDPIDGTKGFIRGEQYAVALALIEQGEVVLGVLGCPNLPRGDDSGNGAIFVAERGAGAKEINPESGAEACIRVQDYRDFSAANFCESVETGHSSHGHSEKIAEKLGITTPPFRIDSQCKYAAVARGQASVYLRLPTRADYVEKIWDHAAGAIVVEEAGGKVCDIFGNALDFSCGRLLEKNKGVVVTNEYLHADTVSAVKETLNPESSS